MALHIQARLACSCMVWSCTQAMHDGESLITLCAECSGHTLSNYTIASV